MKCECGRHIGTPDFMKNLDASQLVRAIDIATNLLDRKNAETKVQIFRVEDEGICYSNHLTFPAAVSAFSKIADALANPPRELSIVRQLVIESEVIEYCPEYIKEPKP